MTGHELRYQNGFDCQGLWVEVEVEKELGLRSKQDIENLVPGDRFASIDRFVQLCKQRVDRFARIQTQQSIRLVTGWTGPRGRLAETARPTPQLLHHVGGKQLHHLALSEAMSPAGLNLPCLRCHALVPALCRRHQPDGDARRLRTGGASAVVCAFPLAGSPRENLLVWTTTPWTLSSNVACAVHPDLTYLRVRHQGQIYYVARGAFTYPRLEEEFRRKEWVEGVPKLKTVEQIFRERGGYEIVGELRGSEMLGWSYDGPFDELPAQQHPYGYPAEIAEVAKRQGWSAGISAREAHRVIAWDAVGETEGTGIVHIAPGCGAEDFELGKHEKLPPIAPLDDQGRFLSGFGPLTGMLAYDPALTDCVLDSLRQKGLLVAVEQYPHNYPHCWRARPNCSSAWWTNGTSAWTGVRRSCGSVTTSPGYPNSGCSGSWTGLRNMGDWMISKKRYWGLALPIWVCEQCGWFDVIGGRRSYANERLRLGKFEGHSPHRPGLTW
jgi:isoleucyl-tRNA synthetase